MRDDKCDLCGRPMPESRRPEVDGIPEAGSPHPVELCSDACETVWEQQREMGNPHG